jgi:hypothetical protein
MAGKKSRHRWVSTWQNQGIFNLGHVACMGEIEVHSFRVRTLQIKALFYMSVDFYVKGIFRLITHMFL